MNPIVYIIECRVDNSYSYVTPDNKGSSGQQLPIEQTNSGATLDQRKVNNDNLSTNSAIIREDIYIYIYNNNNTWPIYEAPKMMVWSTTSRAL